MLDSIYHMIKAHFCCKNVIILSLYTQRCYGCHKVSRKSINQILLHGVISLPDATSYDNLMINHIRIFEF